MHLDLVIPVNRRAEPLHSSPARSCPRLSLEINHIPQGHTHQRQRIKLNYDRLKDSAEYRLPFLPRPRKIPTIPSRQQPRDRSILWHHQLQSMKMPVLGQQRSQVGQDPNNILSV